jgi:acyl-CoA reductase-like NAD-dependent aldehyde dehydrogenase
VRRAIGIVGVPDDPAAPWSGMTERAGIALMAGNGVLVPDTPAGQRLMRIFERAGLPELVVSVAAPEALEAADHVWRPEPAAPGPMLVLADADLARAAAAAAWSAGRDGGRPATLSEAIVARDVADAFGARLQACLADGVEPPPVVPVPGVEAALERVAGAGAGAVASVWTADRDRAERIAVDLAAPVVWINDHGAPVDRRSPLLFDEVTRAGVIARGGWSPWLPPALPGLDRGLHSLGTLLYGRESDRAVALRDGARPLLALAGRLRRRR